ncbi:6-phosphogluconolactonase [Dyella lipolytica]|uniref:6-phosphogluconolactonase n=1 Tax=Dyella lipolytica TaxID=1867835 RepID=A0ABW8IQC0_9GAMM|nr:6-phosphogluconolactonase [Dyella lipolytica]GLQ45158.1 6-phosphogluconolactonase [Dyella lipolytica]
MAAPSSIHAFEDGHALAASLAVRIAEDLRAAIEARGEASIAVSGGSTPKRLFERLSHETLDWSRVTVTLVDERWVPDTDERSNARMVEALLLRHNAADAEFVPLYVEAATPEAGIGEVRARVAAMRLPLDVVVLGMGPDGHTASFFPGGDRLAEALDIANTAQVVPMRAPGAGEPRITFTLPVLLQARSLYLHIEGPDKRVVLEQAEQAGSPLPIASVLRRAQHLEIYWCP